MLFDTEAGGDIFFSMEQLTPILVCLDGSTVGWTDGRMVGWIAERMAGQMDGLTDGSLDRWMAALLAGRMDGRMAGWIAGRMDGSMDWLNVTVVFRSGTSSSSEETLSLSVQLRLD